jgi:hypothetical protein
MSTSMSGSNSTSDLSAGQQEATPSGGTGPVLLGSQSTSTLHKKKPVMMAGRPGGEGDDADESLARAEEAEERAGSPEKKTE